MVNIKNDWDEVLKEVFLGENYQKIREFLKREYFTQTIYPPMQDIFNAFRRTPYNAVKAVILGQDPYHEPNQAHGLSFSVLQGVALPPSLINIFKELKSDLGIENKSGCLYKWADEGVLLLNSTLTVRRGQANSHASCGWPEFTDTVIKKLSEREKPMVFLLWGGNARRKKALINTKKHLILESAHPSPLSAYAGFFGSKPFSKTNEFLISTGQTPIEWKI